jgi:heparosan-N-sulfate-glucuronate 5-epimerase
MLLAKHLRDVAHYVSGNAEFELNEAALRSWAYPVSLEFTLERETRFYSPKDAAGLPLRVYKSVGRQYNPTRIAGYGLAHFNRYLASSRSECRETFMKTADWFAAAGDGRWSCHFDWNDLKAPWISCLAQGQGISVLARAYHLTGEAKYLKSARMALTPLSQPLLIGGVRSHLDDASEFLEEYPSSAPVHVLNGFLFALIGIYDLMRLEPASGPSVGFDELVQSLESNIGKWDLGYWSAYDVSTAACGIRNAATMAYHRLHITLLRFLGTMLNRGVLRDTADRWDDRSKSVACRLHALTSKVLYRSLMRTQR